MARGRVGLRVVLVSAAACLLVLAPYTSAQCDNLPDGTSCNGIEDGTEFPDPDDCASFYECNNGCAEHKLCQRNFLFHMTYGCFYPTDVECGERPCNNAEHCVTTTTVTTTEDCGHPWEGDCSELGEGHFPDPYNCRKYWTCMGNLNAEHKICKDGLLFKPEKQWCDYPENVNCGERPVCDDCDGNCVTNSPPPIDCGHYMNCTGMADGYYPDPYNCRKYWHCYGGDGEHIMCDDNLVYDPVNVWCNFPESVDCGDRPVCNVCDEDCVIPSTPNPDCDHPMDCTAMPDGWYPDPYNCRKYWHCEAGKGHHYTCQDSFLFDPVHVWCDWPYNVDCGGRPVCDDCDQNCHPNSEFLN